MRRVISIITAVVIIALLLPAASFAKSTECVCNCWDGDVVNDHFNQENDNRQKRAVQAGAKAVGHIGTVIKNGNVRSLPDKDSRKVGSVQMNQRIEILDCQQVDVNRMWYLIQLWDGSYGWVSAMLVEVYDVFNYGY